MRGKTQLEQNKSKDRNANGRVDPFHMPTELADGLGAESLPREQPGIPISPCRAGSRESELDGVAQKTHAGFSAPPLGMEGLGGQASAKL